MPIALETPIQPPSIVAKELTAFTVDLANMTVQVRFSLINSEGAIVSSEDSTLSLMKDGHPRFDPVLYGAIKGLIYGMALED